jgi:hypothetical protein
MISKQQACIPLRIRLHTRSNHPTVHIACAYWLCCSVLHVGSDDATIAGSSAPLSGLDVQGSLPASAIVRTITSVQLKSTLSMQPITTHVNVLLAGCEHYLGKAPHYSQPGDFCTA